MPNLVTNPGRETDEAWVYTFPSGRSTANPHSGAWSAFVQRTTGLGGAQGVEGQSALPVVPGDDYQLTTWIDGRQAAAVSLRCFIDPGDGVFVELGRISSAPAWQFWEVGTFVAVGPLAQLEFRASGLGAGIWWLDDTSVESIVAVKRREIKDGILATLPGITIANGYSMDVATVTGDKLTPQTAGIRLPLVRVVWSGQEEKWLGNDAGPFPVEMHRKGSVCPFSIGCYASTEDEVDELAGHVEKILETQVNGQFLGLAYVRDVVVDAVLDPELAQEQAFDYFARFVRATVSYKHTRGQP